MPGTSCGSRTTYTASRFWVPCSVRSKPAPFARWTRSAIGPLPGLSSVDGSCSRQCSQPARDRCAMRCRPSTSRSRNFPCRAAPVTVNPPSELTGGSNVFSTLMDATSTRATTWPTALSVRKSTSACTSGSSGTALTLGPAELVEPLVVDAEVMRDLVHHGHLHLPDDGVEVARTAADRQPGDGDPVREDAAVRRRTRRQRHALIEAEQVRRTAVVLDDDGDVAHQSPELGRDRVERRFDEPAEGVLVDVDQVSGS